MIAQVVDNMKVSTVNNKQIDIDHIKNLADSFAYVLQDDNPKFNVEKFLKACGTIAV